MRYDPPGPCSAALTVGRASPGPAQASQADDQDTFSAGLAWATRDINPNVSLLQPAGPDSYIVYDYALDLISHTGHSDTGCQLGRGYDQC